MRNRGCRARINAGLGSSWAFPPLARGGPSFLAGGALFHTRVRPRGSISLGVPTPKDFQGPGSPAYSTVVCECALRSEGSNLTLGALGAYR